MKKLIASMPFYPNEFISETMFLAPAEIGMYIKILCAVFIHGRLELEQIVSLCGGVSEEVLSLFERDELGRYYKQKMEQECEKRESYLKAKNEKKAASEKRKSERAAEKARKAENNTHTYGIYENVSLSDEEYMDLYNRFGSGLDVRIKALSTYMKVSGKKYKSHYAVIIHWDEKSKEKLAEEARTRGSTFDTDDFWEAAVAASEERMRK